MALVKEPFSPRLAGRCVRAILDGPGMTVFTRKAKEDFMRHDMTSTDAVNVLRGGRIAEGTSTASGWTYCAETQRMSVAFSFRGSGRDATSRPNELVIERAWRNNR
jgi:hypothetical protein